MTTATVGLKKAQGAFLAFAEINEYISYWADRENFELRDVRPGDPMIGHRSSTVSNEISIGGVTCNLFLGGAPVTERLAASLCCAASLRDGTPFSMSQARQCFQEYLWAESRRLMKEAEDRTIAASVTEAQS